MTTIGQAPFLGVLASRTSLSLIGARFVVTDFRPSVPSRWSGALGRDGTGIKKQITISAAAWTCGSHDESTPVFLPVSRLRGHFSPTQPLCDFAMKGKSFYFKQDNNLHANMQETDKQLNT